VTERNGSQKRKLGSTIWGPITRKKDEGRKNGLIEREKSNHRSRKIGNRETVASRLMGHSSRVGGVGEGLYLFKSTGSRAREKLLLLKR